MKAISLILGICPGFGGLMHYGRFSHLVTVFLFLLSFNVILFLDAYWIELVPSGYKKWTFILLGAIWIFLSYIADSCSRKYEKIENDDVTGEKFLEILTVYLRGEWEAAERLAKLTLKQNPRDVEMVLFLATFYRHQQRFAEAFKMHDLLERLEGADRWYYEIYIEKNELKRAMNQEEEDEDHLKEENEEENIGQKNSEMIEENTGSFSKEQTEKSPAVSTDVPLSEEILTDKISPEKDLLEKISIKTDLLNENGDSMKEESPNNNLLKDDLIFSLRSKMTDSSVNISAAGQSNGISSTESKRDSSGNSSDRVIEIELGPEDPISSVQKNKQEMKTINQNIAEQKIEQEVAPCQNSGNTSGFHFRVLYPDEVDIKTESAVSSEPQSEKASEDQAGVLS